MMENEPLYRCEKMLIVLLKLKRINILWVHHQKLNADICENIDEK